MVTDTEELIRRSNPLVYYGVIDSIPAPNQFVCADLSGFGVSKFTGALGNAYCVFVLRDVGGAGAAPQGEVQPVTAYASGTGTFTHSAFSVALTQGDEILIVHPAIAAVLPTSGTNQGLYYYGKVTAIPGANQCTIPTLAGLGEDKFVAGAAGYSYYLTVIRDAGGAHAAPQGEFVEVTDYVSATGVFTHNALTVAMTAGDEVLIIHPSISQGYIIRALMALPAADAVANSYIRDGMGNKASTALYAATNTADLFRYLKGLLAAFVISTGTFTTSSATVPADTSQTAVNDHYKGHTLMPVAGVCAFEPRPIRQYTATTDVFTLDEPFTQAPGLVAYVVVDKGYPIQRLLDIFNVVNAILELTETGGSVTTDGTEQDLYRVNIPAAVFKPLMLDLDCTNMVAGDQIELRTYYRKVTGGNMIKQDDMVFSGPQNPASKVVELHPNRYGILVSITRLLGTDRAYQYSVSWEG